MTLTVAWLRWTGDVQELVVASDSRLSGGVAWDSAPKIMPLERGDCALAFAGETMLAYPMMIQIANALRMHRRSLNRALDLAEFKGRVVSIINHMRAQMHTYMEPRQSLGEEKTYLLLAGYSWRNASFVIWTLHYDSNLDAFTFRPASPWPGTDGRKMIAIVGELAEIAKDRLRDLLRSRGKVQTGGFDMEPFEVLRDVVRENLDPHTGGPLQIVKVYRHMNVTPFPVYWPDKQSGSLSFLGRPLEAWEDPGILAIDPDSPGSWQSPA
jgi:hypothetical protein